MEATNKVQPTDRIEIIIIKTDCEILSHKSVRTDTYVPSTYADHDDGVDMQMHGRATAIASVDLQTQSIY